MNRTIVKRDFLGMQLQQIHDNKFFCLTDFIRALEKYHEQRGEKFTKSVSEFMRRPDTLELIKAIQDNEGLAEIYITKKGKNGGTYAHPLLLVELAMYCDSTFKYKALNWVKDKLCEYRDSSGESYKKLSGVIQKALETDSKNLSLAIIHIAKTIKEKIGVDDWNTATEAQLTQRDKYHRDIMLLCEAGIHPTKALEVVINRKED